MVESLLKLETLIKSQAKYYCDAERVNNNRTASGNDFVWVFEQKIMLTSSTRVTNGKVQTKM